MKKQIIPFVDHEIGYRLLQKLVACTAALDLEIPAVITTRDNANSWWPGVEEICLKENLPLYIYETFIAEDFAEFQPDWILLLSWKHLIPTHLIKIPKNGALNLHYSLLPEFRGVYPVNWSIIKGNETAGFTYHFVNEKIDDGEPFMQAEVPVRLSDTARTLQLRIDDAVCDNFNEFIERLLHPKKSENIASRRSNSGIANQYYSKRKFGEACALDLNANYRGIDFLNLLRGLTFFPDSKNAYFYDKTSGKKIYISIDLREE